MCSEAKLQRPGGSSWQRNDKLVLPSYLLNPCYMPSEALYLHCLAYSLQKGQIFQRRKLRIQWTNHWLLQEPRSSAAGLSSSQKVQQTSPGGLPPRNPFQKVSGNFTKSSGHPFGQEFFNLINMFRAPEDAKISQTQTFLSIFPLDTEKQIINDAQ